ncbi:MAG: thiamine pyrophosphate-binding protein [Betaproteobacteria bacterium]|nr:MAG: thiamine pyrophosphate-binding protein [Betaproteobacteria bacterium]
MRVSDYLARALRDHGIRHVFMLTGGGAMHLNDAFGRCEGLEYICCHHEQASAIAAESYFRLSGRLAALNVTTGPGGINALNGVFGAWVDSLGMVVISGQVKRETIAGNYPLSLRQLGDQEADVVSMVRPITKYATLLQDPSRTREVIERAITLARTGRPGPVWVDVPIDVQAAPIDPAKLRPLDPETLYDDPEVAPNARLEKGALTGARLAAEVDAFLARLHASERPAVLAGAGVRIAGAHDLFLRVMERLGLPVTSGWNAHDVIANGHSCYAGRPGSVGDRGGNFAVQNADLLLILGSRLNIRQISYNWASFARAAAKVMIDIDPAELHKPTLKIDQPIHCDLRDFLQLLEQRIASGYSVKPAHRKYLVWCKERVAKYSTVLPEYWQTKEAVNPYCFMETLFKQLDAGDIVVSGDGTACVTSFQAAELKAGQRLFTNSGCASMGYDLPAAIGAWYASGAKRIICLAGDGSVMMNLQELQTIVGNRIPVKLFILNNTGYHSIRQTQQAYFPDNVVGCGPDSKLTFPDFQKVLAAFGFSVRASRSHADMHAAIRDTLGGPGAQACEVFLDKSQVFAPKLSSRRLDDGTMVSSPLEDLAPFLPRDEFAQNMLIPPMN